jgi:group I intron endonuclease
MSDSLARIRANLTFETQEYKRDMFPAHSIYLVFNQISEKVYIGQTKKSVSTRWSGHCTDAKRGRNSALLRAIRKYPREIFYVQTIAFASNKEEADNLEKIFIILFQSTDSEKGYNCTAGGESFPEMFGNKNPFYGKKHSQEVLEKISAANKGIPETKESNEKRRVASLRNYSNRNGLFVFNMSDENRKPKSLTTRAKMSVWQIGRKLLEETKNKLRESAKKRWRERG